MIKQLNYLNNRLSIQVKHLYGGLIIVFLY
nr:MAG TPA: hypothetical protein [Caudoviricetes sp.]